MRAVLVLLTALALMPDVGAAAPTPLLGLRTLRPQPNGVDSTFGRSVAFSGSQILVGDPGHWEGLGAAYLFDARTGAKLRAWENESSDIPVLFGRHVTFLGTAPVVGGSGAFRVFDQPPGSPGRLFTEAGFPPSDVAILPGFGRSLAQLDATHLLVGFPKWDTGPGTVLVIDTTSGATTSTLDPPTPAIGDHFGLALALTPTEIVVGAPSGDFYGGTDEQESDTPGAVHVFDRGTLAWKRTITPSDSHGGDFFGHAVATNGTMLVVGAPGTSDGVERAGAAYLFDLETGAQLRRIANPTSPTFYDTFGFSVAALPDRVVIGAPGDDTSEEMGNDAPGAGTAFVFGLDGTMLQTLLGFQQSQYMGWSMTAVGGGVAIGSPSPIEEDGNVGLFSPCGDGVVDPAEACDDGNRVDGDGCDSNCTPTACGNSIVTAGEECDEGPLTHEGGRCLPTCKINVCGDGIPRTNECDDGNLIDGDGCDATCRPSICFGGGTIEKARLTIDHWGEPFGDERVRMSGRLRFANGAPPLPFDPSGRGAQIRAEVVAPYDGGLAPLTIVGMDGLFGIVPGLRGTACTPADGWRVRSKGKRHTYANPSTRLFPPACQEISGGLVDLLDLTMRAKHTGIDFKAQTPADYIESEDLPTIARITLILGGEPTAGPAGDCAIGTIARCKLDRRLKRLTCR
jgi:cysteine-rich repeat protein